VSKEIALSQGKFAIVDDEDYERVSQFNWHVVGDYAVRRVRLNPPVNGKRQGVQFMHRLIMGEPQGLQVDHRNRNPLDNQRHNLRIATNSQNRMNASKPRATTARSRYKGVAYGKEGWQAQIMKNGKSLWLGYFASEIEAAHAYDVAARDLFGEFACINFSQEHAHE